MATKTNNQTFILKAYSPKEIRAFYGVSIRTFKKWTEAFAEELGEVKGKFYTVSQIKLIIEKLGTPGVIELS